jgi:hypothetical protein
MRHGIVHDPQHEIWHALQRTQSLQITAAAPLVVSVNSPALQKSSGSDKDLGTSSVAMAVTVNTPAAVEKVPLDATSGIACPITQAQWNAIFAKAGVSAKTLTHSWAFQDASGNITATVGTDLTVSGTLDYQQTVSGWTRKGTRFTNTAGENALLTGGAAPVTSTTSSLWLAFIDITATPSGNRCVMAATSDSSNTDILGCKVTAASKIRVHNGATTADTPSNMVTGGVRPFVHRYDRTNSNNTIYLDAEKASVAYASYSVDGSKGFGAVGTVNSCAMDVLLGAAFAGSAAEWSDANVKAVLQAMGWTIPWS